MNITDIATWDQAAKLSNFSRSKNLITIPYVHTTAAAQKTQSRTIEIKCTMGNQARAPAAAKPKKVGNRFSAIARIKVKTTRLIDLASSNVRGSMGRCTSTSLSLALKRKSLERSCDL